MKEELNGMKGKTVKEMDKERKRKSKRKEMKEME